MYATVCVIVCVIVCASLCMCVCVCVCVCVCAGVVVGNGMCDIFLSGQNDAHAQAWLPQRGPPVAYGRLCVWWPMHACIYVWEGLRVCVCVRV